jgi:hypothetical protein
MASPQQQPSPQQQQPSPQQPQPQPPPAFALKQANAVAAEQCGALKQHSTVCFAKYFCGESSLIGPQRPQVYAREASTAAGTVKAAGQHPLVGFLTTPKLPPELAAYLDPK